LTYSAVRYNIGRERAGKVITRGTCVTKQYRAVLEKSRDGPGGVTAQVLVTDGTGSDYLLPYPCTLTADGWVNAASGKPLAVRSYAGNWVMTE
jgi:hypothetical protein